tara:strand:+ start:4950 stop:6677 length:1728 start_codon:yes stop_codon:yes gene_type:complete
MISSTAKQKGTALTWVVSLFFIFMMVALAIDSGRLYYEKRQLQAVADVLASNLADRGQSCASLGEASSNLLGEIDVQAWFVENSRLARLAEQALEENSISASLVALEKNADGQLEVDELATDLGSNGVSVSVIKRPGGLLYFVAPELSATSVAKKEVVAGLQVESGIVGVNAASSALLTTVFTRILGTDAPTLVVGDLNQLANSLVDLSDVLAGVAGVGNLLGPDGIPVANLLDAILDSAEGLGGAASTISDLANAAAGLNVRLEDVIEGISSAEVPEGSSIPVLGLVTSIILNVDNNALNAPITISLAELLGACEGGDCSVLNTILAPLLSLLGAAGTGLDVEIDLEPGPGFILSPVREVRGVWPEAETSAITASVVGRVSLLGLGLVDVDLEVKAANARVRPEGVTCVSGQNNTVAALDVNARASLASIDANLTILELGPLEPVSLEASADDNGGGGRVSFVDIGLHNYDGQSKTSFYSGGESVASLIGSALDSLELDLLGGLLGINSNGWLTLGGFPLLPLGDVLDPIEEGLLEPLLVLLIDGLLPALGVTLVPSELQLVSIGQSTVLLEEY